MMSNGEKSSQLMYSAAQNLGTQLKWNEDSILGFVSSVCSEQLTTDFGLFLLADGMGGYEEGVKASSMAISTLASQIIRKVYLPLLHPSIPYDQEPLQEILAEGMLDIHQKIQRETQGAGTTLTAVVFLGETMHVAHIGDSRAYLVDSAGVLSQITQDQSYSQRLVDMGQMTEEESRTDPRRNELFAALGKGDTANPIIFSQKRPTAGFLFLCSDGMWEVIRKDDLQNLFASSKSPAIICDDLISAAIYAGAADNVSVIVAKL